MPDFKKMEIKFANSSSVVGIAAFSYMFFGTENTIIINQLFENGPKGFRSRNYSEKL